MNKNLRISLIAVFLLAMLALSGCTGITYNTPGLVVGQTYRLDSGETLNEDLTVIGGSAVIEEDSVVNGEMAVIGGNVTIDGTVNGNLSVMGGYVYLDDHARIEGEVQTLGGTVQRANGAVVEGKDVGRSGFPGPITAVRTPGVQVNFEPVTSMLMAIFQAMALAALAVVINLFAPRPMDRTGQVAMAQAPASGGVGCLTLLLLVVMAVTIILIPVSLLGLLVAGAAIMFGWAALGLILGRRMTVWLNQTWTDPVSAGIGTLTLSLLSSLIGAIPCIGWTVPFAVAMVSLGAVVLTRFGTQLYPSTTLPAPRPGGESSWQAHESPGAVVYPSTPPPAAYPPEEKDTTSDNPQL